MSVVCFQPSGRCLTDDGSYSPSMDKPEQALDFVQDAVSSCGYNLGTDIHIVLNCAASEFYDQVGSVNLACFGAYQLACVRACVRA